MEEVLSAMYKENMAILEKLDNLVYTNACLYNSTLETVQGYRLELRLNHSRSVPRPLTVMVELRVFEGKKEILTLKSDGISTINQLCDWFRYKANAAADHDYDAELEERELSLKRFNVATM